ncbi:putative disease resistance protein RGA1 [Citrus clementina]|uniref:putative disease resistance protein RGA1 n=1 Tax=Citrus clementina TaxID=85681 RepID=UPI000CECE60B|nr:putative disease resistance protein RGA1 [Citrus x clementina]
MFKFVENVSNNVKKPERVRTTSLIDEGEVFGRDDEKNELLELDIISIEQLAEEECWLLFKRLAFFGRSFEDREKLEPIGRKIARKCKGLPLAVKCFSYCAVFPKDHYMHKNELIDMWMAQGYLNAEEDEEMEMIGEEYFNILATHSFFQEFETYGDDNEFMRCKMHDIVHDFAQFVSSKECLWLEISGTKESVINSFGEKVRHLGLNFEGERLPETLCELYNLQKLDIRGCENLRELPAGIGKLMNMRSLLNGETYSLKYMPIGISKLTSLRTLDKFVVGGGVDGSNTCRLESLKNLQLLRECGIEGLGNVSHLDEAERLQLYNKKNLLRLRLVFGGVVDGEAEEGRRKNKKDKQLLEAL